MANLGHPRIGSEPLELVALPFGRHRLTTREQLTSGWKLSDQIIAPWDTPATKLEKLPPGGRLKAILADLVLIDGQQAQPQEEGWAWVRIYETLTKQWARERADVVDRELNGLERIAKTYVALPGTKSDDFEVGVQEDPENPGRKLGLRRVERGHALWRLTLTYLEPGILSESDDFSNNGKLQVRSITAFGVVPETPEGFVLVGSQASDVEGIPTRVYRFAKGEGEISRDPQSSNNGKLQTVAIRRLSAPDGTLDAAAFAAGEGFVLVSGPSYQEADGHRVWSASFAKGEGEISRDPNGGEDGTALAIRYLSQPAVSVSPIEPPEDFFLVDGPSFQEADGHRVWSATFAKGNDVLITDEDGTRRRIVTAYDLETEPQRGEEHPTAPSFVLSSYRKVPTDLSTRYVLTYVEATDELLELGDATLGVKFETGIQTKGNTDRIITRQYAIKASAAPAQLKRLMPPEITDPVFLNAYIVDQDIKPGKAAAIVARVFAEVPTPYSDWDDMVIQLPGVEPTALQVLDDFPFRSSPTSESIAVRIDRKFYLSNPQRIPRIAEFRPVDAEGNRTNVLTDTTTPTAEEYLAYVASGTYLVDRCSVHRWQGDIWERRTVYFRAQ